MVALTFLEFVDKNSAGLGTLVGCALLVILFLGSDWIARKR